MDQYADIRALPLLDVLLALGWDAQSFKVRKQGTEFFGACPICQPKKNKGNFSFDTSGKFHCFSCSAKGRGSLDLCMAIKKCGFKQAVSFLESISGTTPVQTIQTPAKEIEPLRTENPVFNGASYEKYQVASPWLEARGLTAETLRRFGVFQYENPARRSVYRGKIMIPIRRWKDGELVAYLAREPNPTENQPKYLFPKGFQKALELFGAHELHQGQILPLRVVYLVESPFCVMKFSQMGFPAVSCFGWSVSPQQADILKQLCRGVLFLPDRNKHAEAMQSLAKVCVGLWVKAPELPAGCDDPEFLSSEQVRQLT